MMFEPRLLFLGHLRAFGEYDTVFGQHLPKLTPTLLLVTRERAHGLANPGELFSWSEPVRALEREAGSQLSLKAGYANHEVLVEFIGRYSLIPETHVQSMIF